MYSKDVEPLISTGAKVVQPENTERSTHLDPLADSWGVTGCNCWMCQHAREHQPEATASQQLEFLARDALRVLTAIVDGAEYDPGYSDLDNEQPITVRMTLRDYRRARRLKAELEKM